MDRHAVQGRARDDRKGIIARIHFCSFWTFSIRFLLLPIFSRILGIAVGLWLFCTIFGAELD